MNIGLHNDAHSSDTIELDFLVLLLVQSLSHPSHVCAASIILLVSWDRSATASSCLLACMLTFYNNIILGKLGCQPQALIRLDPRIVVNYKKLAIDGKLEADRLTSTLNVLSIHITMEPNIC
jgi:hypothetical protein